MNKKILAAVPEFIARLTIGYVFIDSGWQKFHNLSMVTEYFISLHIPFASVQAPFVAGVELLCGVLIMLGLFTRFASLPLMATMVVALATAKREEITDVSALVESAEFLYIVILSWLGIYGSQFLAIDQFITKKRKDICSINNKINAA